jgi:hypothetical protein
VLGKLTTEKQLVKNAVSIDLTLGAGSQGGVCHSNTQTDIRCDGKGIPPKGVTPSGETAQLLIHTVNFSSVVRTIARAARVIYLVAAVALVIEYQMSAEKDAKKAAALESRFKNAETELRI